MDYGAMGARVRQWRKKRGMTQEQLAERAGVSPSYLGHIERGTRIASINTIVELCTALDVTPNDLLGIKGMMEEREEAKRMVSMLQELLMYFDKRV